MTTIFCLLFPHNFTSSVLPLFHRQIGYSFRINLLYPISCPLPRVACSFVLFSLRVLKSIEIYDDIPTHHFHYDKYPSIFYISQQHSLFSSLLHSYEVATVLLAGLFIGQ
jgi:hypothetical protein